MHHILGRGYRDHACPVLHAAGHASVAHLRLLPHPGDAERTVQSLVHQLHGERSRRCLARAETAGGAQHQRSGQQARGVQGFMGGPVAHDAAAREGVQRNVRDVLHSDHAYDYCS